MTAEGGEEFFMSGEEGAVLVYQLQDRGMRFAGLQLSPAGDC